LSSTQNKNKIAWTLNDLASVPSNGLSVMSTFACGGGSSLGYKLAGCSVIAANDIDPEMMWHYQQNLNPRHYFLCPINELLEKALPEQLFKLDILDGSPPCSTFSMAGSREKAWGKEKYFKEGQAKQLLSDLFFDYLKLVERLRPKVAIAENVKGMILGNAKGYAKLIMQTFRDIGYRPQLFLVNAADCGVPQRRERVFFCAIRDDIEVRPLIFKPHKRWISAKEALADLGGLSELEREETRPRKLDLKWWPLTGWGQGYDIATKKALGRATYFNWKKLHPHLPSNTLPSGDLILHWNECRHLTLREWKRIGSFPDDYKVKSDQIGKYMIGMSVPPRMTEALARVVIDQWLIPL